MKPPTKRTKKTEPAHDIEAAKTAAVPVASVPEPEVLKAKKRVPEGAPKWHGSDVLALRDKLGLEILPALVPTEAYDTRRWAVDSMTCTEVVLLGEMLSDYASRLASE